MEEETPKPTFGEQFEQYKPVVTATISEDTAYRNACGHSDRENAVIEGNAAVRRAILGSKDMLVSGIMVPISGYLIDKFSTRKLFAGALATFMVGTLLCAVAPNFIDRKSVV